MKQFVRKLKRAVLNKDPSFCDMYQDEPSRQMAEVYLRYLQPALRQNRMKSLTILDAGCQAGRLMIPLAQEGHQLIGIDTSSFALRRAEQNAEEAGVSVILRHGNIAQLRKWIPPRSVDVVLCLEVLYLSRDYRALLQLLIDSVKPGGLVCASYRPARYYGKTAAGEGPTRDGSYHNWHTPASLRDWYQSLSLRWLDCLPIQPPGSDMPLYYLVMARVLTSEVTR